MTLSYSYYPSTIYEISNGWKSDYANLQEHRRMLQCLRLYTTRNAKRGHYFLPTNSNNKTGLTFGTATLTRFAENKINSKTIQCG